ncbi:hypothetical protein SAMN05216216_107109 [Lacicoccus qingdaonensis]|uniref:Uncharacterized protein n=2 Tax=Lacicoccus qingdaonensis TaxID=576118 RepID=A0A1G9E5Y7_9BACL|nr:hypothetical protein SAMN05216216_107109 [Salinicoccus qingdaonensis]
MLKNLLVSFTALNLIYFMVTVFINQNTDVENFFMLPFGLPSVIAFVLFFAGIVTLINENKRYVSWLMVVINGLLMIAPLLLIIFI